MSFWSHWQLRSQAGDFLKALRKQRVYNSDLLGPERVEEIRAYLDSQAPPERPPTLSARR